jgi:ketosteroid isomerase-like protein
MGGDGNVAAMPGTASEVVSTYFDALSRRDLDAMAACWAPDGEEHIAGQVDAVGPAGVRAYFGEIFSAFPDFALTVRQTVAEGDKVAVHWSATGTFAGPAAYQGIEATGARIDLEGLDLLRVADGLIVRNDAFADGVGLARQIGLLPESGSTAEERLAKVFNARTRAMSHVAYNQDTEQARASVRKIAALEPATAWPGHADPVTGDVRAQLEAAAKA